MYEADDDDMEMPMAVALSPDSSKLIVTAIAIMQTSSWVNIVPSDKDATTYIFIINSADGMQISRDVTINHSYDWWYSYYYIMNSSQMHWDPYDNVHLSFRLTDRGERFKCSDGGDDYESKLRIAKIDVSTPLSMSVTSYYE